MRFAFAASALCLALSVVAIQATPSQTPAPPTAASATPASSQGTTPAAAAAADDAAAKHAKRTACRADAKARKLVGAEKTAYLKSCIDTP
ncbi:MAG TPA: hypothetical protein VGI65_21935 [Steroidobacteraceae bacterium]|jgi:outer membrane biosynthesis protein TonB